MTPQGLATMHLPSEALPFVREFLLEVSRRIPHALGTPPRLDAVHLLEPQACASAAHAFIQWLETAPQTLDDRVEELGTVFASLLDVVQELEHRIRRAVLQARRWVEEDMTFDRAVQEVLEELKRTAETGVGYTSASEVVSQMIHRIEAKGRADRLEAMDMSGQFDAARKDLDRLRAQIARVERRARELRNQSLRDGLTGLWNRRAYNSRVAEEVARAERYQCPLSIALWDVDHFKVLNDHHGHRVGDTVLQALAARVNGMLRRCDFVGRYGGEEFVVILPNTEIAQALVVGEKIRHAASAEGVTTQVGALQVTVSVGVATHRPGGTAEHLFEEADRALYRAKASGRNRVEAAKPSIESTAAASV
jgi:diguanylate cyclase